MDVNTFRHESNPFNIDVWYPLVKEITFNSYFIPLEREEGKAILKYYDSQYLDKGELTYKDIEILKKIENKIDDEIKKHNLEKKGAFLRLCLRSPKDGDPYESIKIYEEYKNNIEKLSKEYSQNKDNYNLKLIAMLRTHSLKINNGKEGMNLILTSERIHSDIADWLVNGGKEQIVLREYNDDLYCDYEFRVFIYKNKLTAISQYETYGFYPHLIHEKDKLEKLIYNFWLNNIKDKIKFPSYIIDCGYINGNIILIEISPFLKSTGSCCFRWDKDEKELKSGNGKLKIKTEIHKNLDFFIEEWEKEWKNNIKYDFYFKESILSSLSNLWNNLWSEKIEFFYLFVGSVLKKGFYWNKKFLKYFFDEGEVNGLELFVDKSGMGWIGKGKKIKGEIWKVSKDELIDIEYFYNICDKKEINICSKNNGIINCIYFKLKEQTDNSYDKMEFYSIEFQNENYNPIYHQILIEEKFLKYSFQP